MPNLIKTKYFIPFLLSAMLLASGCANLAFSGANAVYSRYDLEQNLNTSVLANRAQLILSHDAQLKPYRAVASVSQGDLLLIGQVPQPLLRERAMSLMLELPGIRRIYNQIQIHRPLTLMEQSEDAWITGQIKTQYIMVRDINPKTIKVITEDRVVYLMGQASSSQKAHALDIARKIPDVRKVVNLLKTVQIIEQP